MITYVKAGNSFIWGTPIRGLPIEERMGVKIQHDGDEIGATEVVKSVRLKPHITSFLLALRPTRSEILRALRYGPEPEIVEYKRRHPPFKFRFFGSAADAYKAFVDGDYRYILRKFDPKDPKHRVAYVKAFLMAVQNPFVKPPEEKVSEFLDMLREIDDSLLYGFYEKIRSFARGSGTLMTVHSYVVTHKDEIIKEIKDPETAALRAYEVGDPDVAKEIMKYSSGVWSRMAEATLVIYDEYGSLAEGFSMITSQDPDEVCLGMLMLMERLEAMDPDVRHEQLHNLHAAFTTRLAVLKEPNIRLPSYIVRAPILGKADLLIQFLKVVSEAVEDLIQAMEIVSIYADTLPLEMRAHVAHDLTLPYLFAREDAPRVLRLYKTIGQAALTPPDQVLLLPLFVAAVNYEEELKYPLERLLINAKERGLYLDAAAALRKALEINSGPVKEFLERRMEEIRSSLSFVMEEVEVL